MRILHCVPCWPGSTWRRRWLPDRRAPSSISMRSAATISPGRRCASRRSASSFPADAFQEQFADGLGGFAVEIAGRLVGEQSAAEDQAPAPPPTRWRSPPDSSAADGPAVAKARHGRAIAGAMPRILPRAPAATWVSRPASGSGRSPARNIAATDDGPGRRSRSAIAEVGQLRDPSAQTAPIAELAGPRSGPFERAEHVEQRALARPGGPEDGECSASLRVRSTSRSTGVRRCGWDSSCKDSAGSGSW